MQFLNREAPEGQLNVCSMFAQRFFGLSHHRTSDKTRPPTKLRENQTNVEVKTDSVYTNDHH